LTVGVDSFVLASHSPEMLKLQKKIKNLDKSKNIQKNPKLTKIIQKKIQGKWKKNSR
jgi:hypothetical protein